MAKEYDFYTGFEGEPEVCISKRDSQGNLVFKIRLWNGYFDAIMSLIKPNAEGNWEGLVLHYHLATGWYEHSPWPCANPALFLAQLRSLGAKDLQKQEDVIRKLLIEELEGVAERREAVFWEYD